MSLPVVFRPEATDEYLSAIARYESKRMGLGAQFVANVERTIDRIVEHPERFAVDWRGVRRLLVSRFPYA